MHLHLIENDQARSFSQVVLFSPASKAAGATAEDSEEAGTEVPEAVTVVVEETHPLPEVSYLGLLGGQACPGQHVIDDHSSFCSRYLLIRSGSVPGSLSCRMADSFGCDSKIRSLCQNVVFWQRQRIHLTDFSPNCLNGPVWSR